MPPTGSFFYLVDEISVSPTIPFELVVVIAACFYADENENENEKDNFQFWQSNFSFIYTHTNTYLGR